MKRKEFFEVGDAMFMKKLHVNFFNIEKAGQLNENERFIMRSHVYHTYQALEPFEVLRPVS